MKECSIENQTPLLSFKPYHTNDYDSEGKAVRMIILNQMMSSDLRPSTGVVKPRSWYPTQTRK